MNIKNVMSKAAIVAVSIGLAAVSAHAGPPRDSGKDVIDIATNEICAKLGAPVTDDEQIRADACDLLFKSDGYLDLDNKCKADPDRIDAGNGFAVYSGRNCEKNESGLERKASSVVISMHDLIEKGKSEQSLTAAGYACVYSSNADYQESVGKLAFLQGVDLVADAEGIANDLGYDCADLLE